MISLIMWLNNHPQVKKAFRKKRNIFSRNIKTQELWLSSVPLLVKEITGGNVNIKKKS